MLGKIFFRIKVSLFLLFFISVVACNPMLLEQRLSTLIDHLGLLKKSLTDLGGRLAALKQALTKVDVQNDMLEPQRLFGPLYQANNDLIYGWFSVVQGSFIVYDIKVLSQNEPWQKWGGTSAVQDWLKEIGKQGQSSAFMQPLYGCGFHSVKNAIYLSRLLTYPISSLTSEKQEILIKNFQLPKKFLKHFEFTKASKKSWGSAWIDRRKANPPPGKTYSPSSTALDVIYTPTALPIDVSSLQAEIEHLHVSAPKFAVKCMKNMFVLESQMGEHNQATPEYLIGNVESDSNWFSESDVKKLVQISRTLKEQSTVLIPVVCSYAHYYGNRHWVTILFNKFNGVNEILFADSWRYANATTCNKHLITLLANWLSNTEERVKNYALQKGLPQSFKQQVAHLWGSDPWAP